MKRMWWLSMVLSLVPLQALATATTMLTAGGWDASDVFVIDGPHVGSAHVERASSGSFDDGGTYNWLASASSRDSRGDMHLLLQTTNSPGFGHVTGTSSVVGSVVFSGSGPRTVRFALDVLGSLQSATGASAMHAGGNLTLGGASSYADLQTLGTLPSAVLSIQHGHVDLISADRNGLHLRLWLEELVIPGVIYELSASLFSSIQVGSPDITSADFSHTAQLSVWLPPDYTMTGANGYLSDLPGVGGGAAPEPRGLAVAAFVALAAARGLRRHSAARR